MTDAKFHRRPSLGGIVTGALAAIAIVAGASWSSAQEEVSRETAKQQLEKQRKELESVRAREKSVADDLTRLKKERAELNARLIETARRIQDSEDKLSATETRLRDLSDQETKVRHSIKKRHGEIAKLLSAMQRIGRHPPPAVVTRRDDALKMVRGAMLLAAIFPEIKYQAENLTRELDGLLRLQTDIRAGRDTLAAQTRTLTAERKEIDGLLTRKRENLASKGKKLAKIQAAAEQHAKTVAYLGDLLKRLDKELASVGLAKYEAELKAAKAREAALAKPKPPESKPNETVIELKPDRKRVAFLSPSRIKPAIPFSDSKGQLPLPARGLTKTAYGKADEFGAKAQGISIKTRPNAQVTSPSDGWVAYAGPFRSYGQLLIINAGEGYHILLAGMRRIDVSLGQFVLAGEPVANMGMSPQTASRRSETARPELYIEFRKDGRPIDPNPWWAEGPEKVQG